MKGKTHTTQMSEQIAAIARRALLRALVDLTAEYYASEFYFTSTKILARVPYTRDYGVITTGESHLLLETLVKEGFVSRVIIPDNTRGKDRTAYHANIFSPESNQRIEDLLKGIEQLEFNFSYR